MSTDRRTETTDLWADLKPCPFCGNEEPQEMGGNEPDEHWVQCGECGALSGVEEDVGTAAAMWNRRVT